MKFKIIASVAVVVVMLLATAVYLASKNSGAPVEGGDGVTYEQVPQ